MSFMNTEGKYKNNEILKIVYVSKTSRQVCLNGTGEITKMSLLETVLLMEYNLFRTVSRIVNIVEWPKTTPNYLM